MMASRAATVGIRAGAVRRMLVLQPAHVAAQLGLDPIGRLIEGGVGVHRLAGPLQDHAVHDMGDDIAGETVAMLAAPEGDMGGKTSREELVRDRVEPVLDMGAKGVARVDLMSRNTNFHSKSPTI